MYSPFQHAGIFLIQTIFNILITLVLLRFLLQTFRVDFYNPLCQFIVKTTNPILKPFRKIIPGLAGIDLASVIVMLLLQSIEIALVTLIATGALLPTSLLSVFGLCVWGFGEIITHTLKTFSFIIFIVIIFSWLPNGQFNPIMQVLSQLVEPLLAPARRLVRPISGFDISPILVLIVIQLADILIAGKIRAIGKDFILL